MRVVVTRPQADGERTAAALEALGHEVLVAPLMRIEPIAADLAGTWSAIVITSANALQAAPATIDKTLPVFAVGDRSAEAARRAGMKPGSIVELEDSTAAIQWLKEHLTSRDAALIKGSHGLRMDRIIAAVEVHS